MVVFLRRRQVKVAYMAAKGFGLVAQENIHAHEFIIEYVGEVIDEDMCSLRMEAATAAREVCADF